MKEYRRHIVLGDKYKSYETALEHMDLESLKQRRQKLCENFAQKSVKNPKFSTWFQVGGPKTRSQKIRYSVPEANTKRFRNSPIPYLTDLLNAGA